MNSSLSALKNDRSLLGQMRNEDKSFSVVCLKVRDCCLFAVRCMLFCLPVVVFGVVLFGCCVGSLLEVFFINKCIKTSHGRRRQQTDDQKNTARAMTTTYTSTNQE